MTVKEKELVIALVLGSGFLTFALILLSLAPRLTHAQTTTNVRYVAPGGTDGANLTLNGLPTPNIFNGGHAFHSKEEWISVQDMEKTVKVLLNIVQVVSEK